MHLEALFLYKSSIEPIARLCTSYDDFETLDLMIGYGFLLSYQTYDYVMACLNRLYN